MTFIVAATSEEDHDLMWFQVNKIVAMVYPQWSDAFLASSRVEGKTKLAPFKYPFTQVPTASPLIRLRVGDIIKSNYSRTNLSRLHGIGDRDRDDKLKFDPEVEYLSQPLTEKQKKHISKFNAAIEKKQQYIKSLEEELDPILGESLYGLVVDDITAQNKTISFLEGQIDNISRGNDIRYHYLKPGLYRTEASNILGSDLLGLSLSPVDQKSIRLDYEVKIEGQIEEDELKKDFVKVKIKLDDKEYSVIADKSKIRTVNPDDLVGEAELTSLRETVGEVMNPVDKDGSINNPITRAYETGMSRGLAGFITNLDVSYNEYTWDTGRIGSKAPMMVKINIGFSPIHDIPPGLDHNGMLRAPVYNVGRINNEFFGDPHDASSGHGSGRDAAMQKYSMIFNKTNKG